MRLSEILEQAAVPMPQHSLFVTLRDHDRVKLIQPITDTDQELHPGMVGTVARCHDSEVYDVEFPGIRGTVLVPRGHLEKI